MTTIARYWKALAAFVGGLVGLYTIVAADRSISFEEVGYIKGTILGLIAALVTAISPKNRED